MPNRIRRFHAGPAALLCTLLCAAPAAQAQWEIKPTDGSSIKFGFLMQGQAESVDVNLAGGDRPERVQGHLVSANFFEILGIVLAVLMD